MIQVHEIRIGNLIEQGKINEIIWCSDFDNERTPQYAFEVEGKPGNWIYLDEANPIPLTSECLLQLGFKPQGFLNLKTYWNKDLNISFSFGNYAQYDAQAFIEINGYKVYPKKLIYVHQFQNVIFSLTDIELTIN